MDENTAAPAASRRRAGAEVGLAHADAERLDLLRAGDHAAVVVGEHGDGHAVEVRLEDALARAVEGRAVDDGDRPTDDGRRTTGGSGTGDGGGVGVGAKRQRRRIIGEGAVPATADREAARGTVWQSPRSGVAVAGGAARRWCWARRRWRGARARRLWGRRQQLDDARDDAPDAEVLLGRGVDGRVVLVGRLQPHAPQRAAVELDRRRAVDDGHDDVAVARLQALVHHEQVAVVDAGAAHGDAFDLGEERRLGALHEQVVEVERARGVVVGGRGEAAGARARRAPGAGGRGAPGGVGEGADVEVGERERGERVRGVGRGEGAGVGHGGRARKGCGREYRLRARNTMGPPDRNVKPIYMCGGE